MRFLIDMTLVWICWSAAYPLSYRRLGEMMQERAVVVNRSSINRWAIRFSPLLEKASRHHKHAVGNG
jgi:putative transposase